jgi:hypothetical protein
MVYDLPVESTKLPVSCLSRTIFWIPKPNTTIATAVPNSRCLHTTQPVSLYLLQYHLWSNRIVRTPAANVLISASVPGGIWFRVRQRARIISRIDSPFNLMKLIVLWSPYNAAPHFIALLVTVLLRFLFVG